MITKDKLQDIIDNYSVYDSRADRDYIEECHFEDVINDVLLLQKQATEPLESEASDICHGVMPSVFIVRCKWSGEQYGYYSSEDKARDAIESRKLIDVYVDSVSVD